MLLVEMLSPSRRFPARRGPGGERFPGESSLWPKVGGDLAPDRRLLDEAQGQ
jgi:hypothetical protein